MTIATPAVESPTLPSLTRPAIVALVLTTCLPWALSAQAMDEPQPGSQGPAQRHPRKSSEALTAPTVGAKPSPRTVTAPAAFSLSLDGDVELAGFVFQDGVPLMHNEGGSEYGNTALGLNALRSLTLGTPYNLSGAANSAFGQGALQNNTAGYANTAIGARALYSNASVGFNTGVGYRALYSSTEGTHNTALGVHALYANENGSSNVAVGSLALDSSTAGNNNTAVGRSALSSNTEGSGNTAIGQSAMAINTTGNSNTAIGSGAGFGWYDGDHNIALGSGASGSAADSGTIRIGGDDNQTRTFIEGIRDATSVHASGFDQDVCINPSEQLGPCGVSSARFKREIQVMGDVSSKLNALRPVSFRYRESGDDAPLNYGLIAEEVAAIVPGLVSYDDEGEPFSVRYQLLTPLLLRELQRQAEEIARLKRLGAEVAELRRRLADLHDERSSPDP